MRGINPDRSQSGAAHRPELLYEHLAPDVAGRRKVADHYKRLIANTKYKRERQLYIDRAARAGRLIQSLTENGRYA